MKPFKKCPDDFNPRSLHGERLKRHWGLLNPQKFQSTLPARGATKPFASMHGRWLISIHAPCTGSDTAHTTSISGLNDFNPRSLHGERRDADTPAAITRHFNPRSLHGERHSLKRMADKGDAISIHAPCTGSDAVEVGKGYQTINFNPRSLHGERLLALRSASPLPISIHAPCTGSDKSWEGAGEHDGKISIHAPCTGSDTAVAV